ncbi:DUF2510 domain-containing protein, partial [Streptomyces sp. AF1A]|uniref:DUF2510 domain-containing protein n=1 Tax=Streptomyces sp. AF1A TaxID=3394350 RepID=UPI0039BD246A
MSAPTPAPGDDRPREGYYPDPSIPGYVRYWNGSSWVPGTSRPAPKDGEPLSPPAGARPAAPSVEETGPHFFDEDPHPPASGPGSAPAASAPADRWPAAADAGQADRGGQDSPWGHSGAAGPADQAQWGRSGASGPAGQPDQGGQWDQPGPAGQPGRPGPWGRADAPGQPDPSAHSGQAGA